MTRAWLSRLRPIALECFFGGLLLAALTFISSKLRLGLGTAGFLFLVMIGLAAVRVSFASTVIMAGVGAVLVSHYFNEPIMAVSGGPPRNIIVGALFFCTMMIVAWLIGNVRSRTSALRESEEHWKEVFEQNPTMYFLIDINASVLSVNEFGASQLGYAVSELVGKSVFGLFHEADREIVQANLAACRDAPGESRVWEVRKLCRNGSAVWVRENAKFVRWGSKDPIFLISCEDITERKAAEDAVRRSQDNLLEAQRLGRIGSWSVDVSSGVNGPMTASPEMLRIFGLDPEKDELTQDLVVERIHPDDRAFMDGLREGRLSARVDYEYDYRIVLPPDGAVRRLHSISHPMIGEDGALLKHVGTTMDVTERKDAEEAVRRSEAYLQEAQRLGHMGSWAHDAATGVMSGSPELFRIFGLDPEKVSLTRDLLGQSIHPDDRAAVVEMIERGRSSNAEIEVSHRIVLPDGSIRHVQGISRPAPGDHGSLQYIGTVMDVTELKKAEEALRQAYADLARVSRITTIGALTASLAHEINQPITAAVANANACLRWLANDEPDLEELREAAAAIVRNGTRAAEIIDRTRKLFEKGAPEREPMQVDDLIRETVLLLSSEASRYAVSIRTVLGATAAEVLADRVQVQQVLMNLILNGIDAAKEVEDRREIAIKSQMIDEKQIMVSVSDNGVGLPAVQAERLFETFFTTKPHGTGMGLSISRSIMSAHGGELWAEPNEPRGAVFRLTLPTSIVGSPSLGIDDPQLRTSS